MIYQITKSFYIDKKGDRNLVRYDLIEMDDCITVVVCNESSIQQLQFNKEDYRNEFGLGGRQTQVRLYPAPSFIDYVIQECEKHRETI